MTHDLDEQTFVSSLHDHVGDIQPDLVALTAGSVRRGVRLRRRRRVGTALAVTACVGAAAVGYAALPSPTDHSRDGAAPAASTDSAPRSAPTVPISGRALTAALLERLQGAVPGGATDFSGQDDRRIADAVGLRPDQLQAVGEVVFTPDATGDPGFVQIGVQATSPVPKRAFTCQEMGSYGEYGGAITACERRVLHDGTIVLLREERFWQEDGTMLVERLADSYHPDQLRVSVRTTNTDEPSDSLKGDQIYDVHGDAPLGFDQLAALAGWETWAPRLPERYETAGAKLAPYDDRSETVDELCGPGQTLQGGRCV